MRITELTAPISQASDSIHSTLLGFGLDGVIHTHLLAQAKTIPWPQFSKQYLKKMPGAAHTGTSLSRVQPDGILHSKMKDRDICLFNDDYKNNFLDLYSEQLNTTFTGFDEAIRQLGERYGYASRIYNHLFLDFTVRPELEDLGRRFGNDLWDAAVVQFRRSDVTKEEKVYGEKLIEHYSKVLASMNRHVVHSTI